MISDTFFIVSIIMFFTILYNLEGKWRIFFANQLNGMMYM